MRALLVLAAVTMLGAPWQPVVFGPQSGTIARARLLLPCRGNLPPVAYQLTDAGVTVRLGDSGTSDRCADAAVEAGMSYRGYLPAGTGVAVSPQSPFRQILLTQPTASGVAALHDMAERAVLMARQ
ncbi:MAG: hypothetical protein ABJD11_12200 [Gemmatimonadota bacterium]